MKHRRARRSRDSGAPKWMVTYSDMVTLILVFFILLFSISQINEVKFEAVSESFSDRMTFEFYPSHFPLGNPAENTEKQESSIHDSVIRDAENDDDEPDSLDLLMQEVKHYLNENNLNNVISASRTKQGVVLILQESILFDTAEAKILGAGKPFLDKIGDLLAEMPNHVRVEGHTDNRSISSYRYPSNWELSGARASSVIRYLINKNQFDESRFIAVGYGDTRPMVPNNSPENWSENRRVEMVILEKETQTDGSKEAEG